ncbi:MAG: hypothetical protein HY585_02340, partial [Candidatus Omnitrophica bacterium]|nr:hypothetical protein [Candidatus Omnitrophota bacterium]
IFIFGSSIIKAPLLSLLPAGRSINLHLGISPYYRGAGTNFWPFVNNELEYVGATLLHIDAGIDTGDIITHVRPRFSADDTVHTVGCKVIAESAYMLIEVLRRLRSGEKLPRVPQWSSTGQRYYRKRDFNEAALKKYHENMQRGIVKEFIAAKERAIQLVQPFNSPARFPSPPLAIS